MKNYKIIKIITLLLTTFLISSCQMELHNGLSESDVNSMLAIMLRNNIAAEKIKDKKGDSFALSVDNSKIPESVQLLTEHGYPKQKYKGIGEIFEKEGLVSSPTEERVRYIFALSQSVEETLTNIDGVIVARVHIVMPENNPYLELVKPSSASVFIKYHPNTNLTDIKSEIKLIVEKSIEGLTYDKVSVVMLPAQINRR